MLNWNIKFELKKFLDGLEKKKILDFGCGDARYKEIISRKNSYTGVDVKISGHPEDNKNYDMLWDNNKLPFLDESFDVVVCTEVLEHVEELNITIQELRRVLKKGGLMFITMPFIWAEHEKPYDFRRFTSFGIKKVFTDYGFNIISHKKLVKGKNAFQQIFYSETSRNFSKYYKNNFIKLFIKIYFNFLNTIFRIFVKLLPKNTFSEIYINNCLIVKK